MRLPLVLAAALQACAAPPQEACRRPAGEHRINLRLQSESCSTASPWLYGVTQAMLAGAADIPPGCQLESERWTDAACRVDRTIVCRDASGPVSFLGYSDGDGQRARGLMTVRRPSASGKGECKSEYEIAAVPYTGEP